MFWTKMFAVTVKGLIGAWGRPQRHLRRPIACASQWVISDKAIRPPIHMLLGVYFHNLTSPLPASCPFRKVVKTVVGVAAKRDSFLNAFQILLIRVHFALPCILSPDTPEHSVGIWRVQLNSSTHPPFHHQMGLHSYIIQYLWAIESACSSPKPSGTWEVPTALKAVSSFRGSTAVFLPFCLFAPSVSVLIRSPEIFMTGRFK